ncbi:MAG: methyltransferase domain-containing protein, partial [Bacteroidia bacterium]|nr:methyltransferase domain-containing protein [Bacteroidia bacterium]
ILDLPFEEGTFDIVVSSEVIEHVPDPLKAITEMHRVLKPGGILVLTTPNRFWYWSVVMANKFNLRKYQGLENWLSQSKINRHFKETGFEIDHSLGIHLFPFVIKAFNPVLDFFHRFNKVLAPVMVNLAFRCSKK